MHPAEVVSLRPLTHRSIDAAEVFLLQPEAASLRRQNQAASHRAAAAATLDCRGGGKGETFATAASESSFAAAAAEEQRDCFKDQQQVVDPPEGRGRGPPESAAVRRLHSELIASQGRAADLERVSERAERECGGPRDTPAVVRQCSLFV